jgi:hypothetical protein
VRRRTGQAFWVADLAREYGFKDVDGKTPDAQKLHEQLTQSAPAFWKDGLSAVIFGAAAGLPRVQWRPPAGR